MSILSTAVCYAYQKHYMTCKLYVRSLQIDNVSSRRMQSSR